MDGGHRGADPNGARRLLPVHLPAACGSSASGRAPSLRQSGQRRRRERGLRGRIRRRGRRDHGPLTAPWRDRLEGAVRSPRGRRSGPRQARAASGGTGGGLLDPRDGGGHRSGAGALDDAVPGQGTPPRPPLEERRALPLRGDDRAGPVGGRPEGVGDPDGRRHSAAPATRPGSPHGFHRRHRSGGKDRRPCPTDRRPHVAAGQRGERSGSDRAAGRGARAPRRRAARGAGVVRARGAPVHGSGAGRAEADRFQRTLLRVPRAVRRGRSGSPRDLGVGGHGPNAPPGTEGHARHQVPLDGG
jgi:hypothetical protein